MNINDNKCDLSQLVSEDPNPVLRIDGNGSLLYANQASQFLLEEWKCKPGDKMPSFWQEVINDTLTSGLNKTIDISCKDRIYSFVVVPNIENNYVNLYGSDITDRKKAEDALRDSEENYRQLVELSTNAIVVHCEGKIVYANPMAMKIVGAKVSSDIIGKPVLDFVHPDSRETVIKRIRKGIEDKEIGELIEEKFITLNGSVIDAEVIAIPMVYGGKPAMQVIIHDVTQRKRAEEKLAQEQFFMKTLMDNVPDNIYFKDKDSRFIRINKALCEWFGLASPEEAIGKTDFDFFTIEHAAKAFEDEQKIIETGIPLIGIEEKETWPDGRITWVSTTKMPLRDRDGNIIGTFGISKDITERKLAEDALRETRDYLENLLSFANAPIMVWDANFRITRFNIAFEKLTGYSVYEVVGKHPEILCPVEYKQKLIEQLVRTASGDHLINVEIPIKCKNGGIRIVLWNTANIYADNGKTLIATIAHGLDITEQKQVEEERKRLQTELLHAQKMESLGTLAGGIAHDFNNILGIILGYANLLESRKDIPEKFTESVRAINQAVDRGAALVRQILTFARKTEIEYEPVNIGKVINELISMLRQTFPRVIDFEENIESDLPCIRADRTQVHQAILNLCLNSRDAMPKGGVITITARKISGEKVKERFPLVDCNEYVLVSVSDTGCGMDEETLKRIFDPFFTTKPKERGTGLGLSVVYGIMQAHKGFIDVESSVGQGTTFYLYFPVGYAIENVETKVAEEVSPRIIRGNEVILLVEDEEFLLEMMKFLLQTNGYKVYSAKDGIEAIELYQKYHDEIDLVLSDLGLPKIMGRDVFMELKEINPKIKIIFASGYFEPEKKAELLSAGAKGFIQKPYVPDEVLKLIRHVLDEK